MSTEKTKRTEFKYEAVLYGDDADENGVYNRTGEYKQIPKQAALFITKDRGMSRAQAALKKGKVSEVIIENDFGGVRITIIDKCTCSGCSGKYVPVRENYLYEGFCIRNLSFYRCDKCLSPVFGNRSFQEIDRFFDKVNNYL